MGVHGSVPIIQCYCVLAVQWLYYPDEKDPSVGVVTFWNSMSQIDAFVDQTQAVGIGGVFTWTSTSDAADWRVHKHLGQRLRATGRQTQVNE